MPFVFINRRATGFAPAHEPSVYPASARVIEKNGGERLDTLNHEGERLYRYRYCIRRNAA